MMGLRLDMSQSLTMEQRCRLEQSLEANLLVVQECRTALIHEHRKQEEICTRIYRRALRHGRVFRYEKHGILFEYALVSKREVPAAIQRFCGHAFSHCLYDNFTAMFCGRGAALARGSWLLFVISDFYPDMPQEAIEYAAVHERGEMVTLGDHTLARKLEFGIAAREKKLQLYLEWAQRHCPSLIGDAYSYEVHTAVPDDEAMQASIQAFLSSEEAQHIRDLINEIEWPMSVLRRMERYRSTNELISGIMQRACEVAEQSCSGNRRVLDVVDEIRTLLSASLKDITPEMRDVLNPARQNDFWYRFRTKLETRFLAWCNIHRQALSAAEYAQEMLDAKVGRGLPTDGVLSMKVEGVLSAI